jgi:hypothetical protein
LIDAAVDRALLAWPDLQRADYEAAMRKLNNRN